MSQDDTIDNIVKAQSVFLINELTTRASEGYRIPDYQRAYSWGEKNIKELFETLICGAARTEGHSGKLSPVFLGAIILSEENTGFEGTSFLVIDGQQRLTSLMLIISELKRKLNYLYLSLDKESKEQDNIKNWIKDKVLDGLTAKLFSCNFGECGHGRNKEYFPKLVGQTDKRLEGKVGYESSIGHFLFTLNGLEETNEDSDKIIDYDKILDCVKKEPKTKSLFGVLEEIHKIIDAIANGESELEPAGVDKLVFNSIEKKDKSILLCSTKNPNKDKTNKMIGKIKKDGTDTAKQICLLSFFSNYLLERSVFHVIKLNANYEDYALDIFESLNTTGEQLTAIQTLKPHVISHIVEQNETFEKSDENKHFNNIDKYLDIGRQKKWFPDKAKESAALTNTFFYYQYGEKIGKKLNDQRKKLRDKYNSINNISNKPEFVKAFADIVKFKENCWWNQQIEIPDIEDGDDILNFFLCFIKESDTELTVPILTRFYTKYIDNKIGGSKESLAEAIKSLAVFIVLRRAFTGKTDGIDSDFREILEGLKEDEEFNLQEGLKKLLTDKILEKHPSSNPTVKNVWIEQAKGCDIYNANKAVCKFLLLCSAAHGETNDGTNLRKIDSPSQKDLGILRKEIFKHDSQKTIEHIAPTRTPTPRVAGDDYWGGEIYSGSMVDQIGNLTILPVKENSSISNNNFEFKKKCYKIFITNDDSIRNELIEELIKHHGGDQTERKRIKKIFTSSRSSGIPELFQPIINAKKWDSDSIEKRSENILSIFWDKFSPVLGY